MRTLMVTGLLLAAAGGLGAAQGLGPQAASPGPRGAPVPASHVSEIRQILTRQVLPRVDVSCPPWTDHPIDAADTPVKPLHIAELRRCIDRILGVDWRPGEHVTVANVRLEASGPGTFRYVKGTIRNSGSMSFGGFPKVWARFYDAANLLVAQEFDYVRPAATFPAGAQQTFSILLETSDTRGWAYYRLAFTDDDRPISCAGCGEQRRSGQRQP
ncbi:MAG: hypothetical protein OXH04_22530 [Acidobacteria bacterium]|nr:hypothetical protein [Acidobacteriota bacterium]